jgi:RimJ/RimL family protein N-acetyltransferase
MPSPVTLTGRGVSLQPLTLEHTADLVRAASESRENYRFTTVPDGEEAMRRYIQSALYDQEIGEGLPFAVFDLVHGRFVGSTRFLNIEYWPAQGPGTSLRVPSRDGAAPSAAEIGYTWYGASAQRTHVNTESKFLLLSHAFETWGVHRVSLKTDARNQRSRAAIQRLGAQFDGTRRGDSPAADGGVRDAAYYSILAGEWPQARSALLARLDSRSAAPASESGG